MKAVGLVIVVAVVAACSLLPLPGIETTIPARPDTPALRVVVVDHTGIVAGVTPVDVPPPQDWSTGAVRAVAGRDDAVTVSWVGGSCDDSAVLTLDPDGDRVRLTIETRMSAAGCDAVGHFRGVQLNLARAVDEAAFVVADPGP